MVVWFGLLGFNASATARVSHEEADITMIPYLLMAAEYDTPVIRILSDDTDVFVLLVYWVYR